MTLIRAKNDPYKRILLYKDSKNVELKIRALVGLCKVGSSHGGDVSKKVFNDGSCVKLARQCRKFLMVEDDVDEDTKNYAIEGLSYLTLDAEVKEELSKDEQALTSIYQLTKSAAKNLTKFSNLLYPSIHIFINLLNCLEDKSNKNEAEDEMKEIAKFAKQHVPEKSEFDDEKFVEKRGERLVESGIVSCFSSVFVENESVDGDGNFLKTGVFSAKKKSCYFISNSK